MNKQLELAIKGHETHGSWVKWDLPDGYEFQDKEGNVINTNTIKLVKKQSKYPKSYYECCKVLDTDCTAILRPGYKYREFENFQKLLICRDAYWKIAGEEIGLGKHWEPDWNESSSKYIITVIEDKLVKHFALIHNYILAFPTEEMRDAFYENFKDLIEKCKKLL